MRVFIPILVTIVFTLTQNGFSQSHQHDYQLEDDDGLRVLLFSGTGWYRHPEIPAMNGWLVRTGAEHGMQVDISETGKDISAKVLSNYDVLLLNNANVLDKVLDEEQRKAVEDWYRAGGAIVALHAVLVHQENWPWIMNLGGCDFNSDSEFLKAKVIVDPAALEHPTVKGWGKEFWYEADWTNHNKSVTGLPGVQVLLRVDESTYEPVRDHFKTRGGKPMGKDHPIAWTRIWDGGRLFYTELGHDLRSLNTEFGEQHIIEGIKWAADVKNKSSIEDKTQDAGFVSLFDGESLDGWKSTTENPESFSVKDKLLICKGGRAHLFYDGEVGNADFKNFELKLKVRTTKGSNSGVYFHTKYQEKGWPSIGFEAQVNSTHTDPKKTGSLYGIVNMWAPLKVEEAFTAKVGKNREIYILKDKAPSTDDEWFDYHIIVKENTVQIKVDGKTTVYWTQPEDWTKKRKIGQGTIGFQAHDPKSEVHYKDIQLKILE